jgi:hypothetical protein
MIRKLFILSLLTLGIGFASTKPAPAIIQCDCDYCASHPGALCYDLGSTKCSTFYANNCAL